MLRIFDKDGNRARPGNHPVDIFADTEAEITGLGETVQDGLYPDVVVTPEASSVACTADLSVGYMLSPSGVWTKFRG